MFFPENLRLLIYMDVLKSISHNYYNTQNVQENLLFCQQNTFQPE